LANIEIGAVQTIYSTWNLSTLIVNIESEFEL